MLKPLIQFDYWGLPIYLIMAIIGFVFAFILLSDKLTGINCTPAMKKSVQRSFLLGFAAALLCAHFANWFLFPEILQYPLNQRIETGGFSFYYGMIGFFVVSALLLRLHKVNCVFWINEIVPSVVLFHAFGRVGCSLSGCCYGMEMVLFGVAFDFPAREIEALALFIMFLIFEKKVTERRFLWYLTCYSVLRFCLEFGRGDDRGVLLFSTLSPAQVTSIAIWIILAAYLTYNALKLIASRNPAKSR